MNCTNSTNTDSMLVKFLYDEEQICSFWCQNYGEMIQFLHYCKKYDVDFYPNNFDIKIDPKYIELMDGIGGSVKDFWITFGSSESIQAICVEIGNGGN